MAQDDQTARPLVLVVAAALIDAQGRVLLAQRPAGKSLAGFWEFPGGKVEPRESPEAALVRELKEELGVELEPDALDPYAFASHAYEDFHLLMPLYLARRWSGDPLPHEAAALAWSMPEEFSRYALAPADQRLAARLAGEDWR